MRILYHLPGDVVGGAETQLKYLVQHLNETIFITYTHDNLRAFAQSMGCMHSKVYSPNSLIKEIGKFKPDIIQFYHNRMMYDALKKGFHNAKVVEVAHNSHHFSFDCTTYPKDRTNVVVCVSKSAEENFRTTYADVPTLIIPNGVDTTIFFPPRNKQKNPRLTGGFCGRLEGGIGKGIGELIEIVGNLPVDFEFVGPDQGGWKEKAAKYPNIRFYPYTKDVVQYYHRWDFFASRSPAEGFGLAIAEALACGLPTIVYNCGGICDYLSPGTHAIIVNNDEEMTKGIRAIIAGHSKLEPGSIDFSARTMALKYKDVYDKLLANKPVSATVEKIRAIPSQVQDLAVTADSWQGVRKALERHSQNFANPVKAPQLIRTHKPKKVVLGGYQKDWFAVLDAAKVVGAEVVCTWHNTPVLHQFDAVNRTCLIEAIRMYRLGFIKRFECPHEGTARMLRSYGIECHFAPNELEMPTPVKKQPGLHIGIFGTGMPWKNIETQVLGAGMVEGASIHVQNVGDDSLLRELKVKYQLHPYYRDKKSFYNLMGSMTVNLAVNFTETFGYQVAESFLLGVPAIVSPNTPVLKEAEGVLRQCICPYIDDPWEISKSVARVLERYEEIQEAGYAHCTRFLSKPMTEEQKLPWYKRFGR